MWALKAGYRHIDTASFYQNEAEIGNALKAFMKESGVKREEIFLTTKLPNFFSSAKEGLADSLKKLQTDYVDLYLIHWPWERRVELWKEMEEMHAAGKARAIGVSNFMIPHLEQFLKECKVVPAMNQFEMSPFLYQPKLLTYCREKGIAITAYSSLTQCRKFDDPTLVKVATKHKVTPAKVLLRWVLQHGCVVIPKSTNEGRIGQNINLFDFSLDDEDMKALNSLDEGFRICPNPLERCPVK